MSKKYNIGVVGATGAVGREITSILEERNFPVNTFRPLASSRSAGQTIDFNNQPVTVGLLGPDSFDGLDIAIFAAGSGPSSELAPIAAQKGCVVVDNSSFWRMDPRVPLIIPEVNPQALENSRGIIANPNCSTIQMLVALKPLHDKVTINRIIVSTYQAVSGTGQKAIDELADQSRKIFNCQEIESKVYPHRIAFNCFPHIDSFLDSGYTKEEMKMINETIKIFNAPDIKVTATCVRMPVFYSHSESIWIETKDPISAAQARQILEKAPGVVVLDEPEKNIYPMPIEAAGKDEVFVGRIREDHSTKNGLTMWVVSDNLRKGAALNTVQIAELLVKNPQYLKTNWSN